MAPKMPEVMSRNSEVGIPPGRNILAFTIYLYLHVAQLCPNTERRVNVQKTKP